MASIQALHRLTRVVSAVLPAGPTVTTSSAQGTVERLRRAVEWSNRRLPRLAVTPDAANAVIAAPVEIVNRHGLLRICSFAVEDMLRQHGVKMRSTALLHAGWVGHRIAFDTKGLWDPKRRVRVLVAPNILTESQRFELDQLDWCKWVALRTSISATHHVAAPHLAGYLSGLIRNLPHSAEELVRFAVLSDSLSREALSVLTPADLSSLKWIRSHDTSIIETAHRHLLTALVGSAVDIDAAIAQTRHFARTVLAENLLMRLLESPENLPSVREYADPEQWVTRVA